MADPRARRVLVVGAGVVGLCAALYAARKGHSVRVVDEGPAAGDGCSFGNSGLVVPSHVVPLAAPGMVALGFKWMGDPESPFYVRPRLDADVLRWGWRFWRAATARRVDAAAPLLRDLHMASRALFDELDGTGDGLFQRNGLLMLCATGHGLDEEARAAERARALGLAAEVLTPSAAALREPALRMQIEGAVYYPLDGHLDPSRLMAVLREQVVRLGVRVEDGVRVVGWRTEGGKLVAARTPTDDLAADAFVLGAGVWSADLARGLGLSLPMLAGKGLSLTLRRPARLPQTPSILTEARVAVTPMGEDLRFGGTMELGTRDLAASPARVRGIVKSAARYFPELGAEAFQDVRPWCGLRPCSPDGLPYIGRFERHPNLIAATGHAMMGVSLGPITGQLVAEVLSGETPSIPLGLLRPDRYS